MPDEQQKKIVNYPGNSHREREGVPPKAELPAKKVERVTTGEVVQRKRPLGRRILESFKGEDGPSVGGYVLFEVLLPAAKTAISDAVSQGIERLLFGEAAPRRGGNRTGYVPYNRFGATPTRPEPARQLSSRARATHDFTEIVLENRGEAEEVIDRLIDIVAQYGEANVADLYELAGATSTGYTDDKWGWTDLRGATVRRVREGYLLELPKPQPLD